MFGKGREKGAKRGGRAKLWTSIVGAFFIKFHNFLGIDIRIVFFTDMERRDMLRGAVLAPFSRPFPKVDSWMRFWSPFGSRLAPF